MSEWRWQWTVQVRARGAAAAPERVRRLAIDQARAEAYANGWAPTSPPSCTITDEPLLPELARVVVEFDVEAAAVCVDCGQRPAFGPGALRCRACLGERSDAAMNTDRSLLACEDKRGTVTGANRHTTAGERPCDACRAAKAAVDAQRAARARAARTTYQPPHDTVESHA